MDIDDTAIREAVDRGVKVALGTDAHDASELGWIRYGIGICRRGWATPGTLLNCMEQKDLLEWAS